MVKPYSLEIRGDLEAYLREHDGSFADNLFYGSEYFFVIKDKGWIVPGATWIRVNQSPVPDISYVVNSDFMLESNGRGKENMSCVGATRGVYNPSKALRREAWSILGLNLNPPARTKRERSGTRIFVENPKRWAKGRYFFELIITKPR